MSGSLIRRRKPKYLHIYDGAQPGGVDAARLAHFIGDEAGLDNVQVRQDFLRHWIISQGLDAGEKQEIARRIAALKITSPDRKIEPREPIYGEISFELRFLGAGGGKPSGIIYDGFAMTALMAELIAPEEANLDHCHIALTNQLPGAWDEDDLRCHARAAVYGYPSIISTTGLVEAPAKPREFYVGKMLGVERADSEMSAFTDECLRRDDPRMTDALKGYVLQALFLHVTGTPFCDDPDCRLFNAHWQSELIRAQLRHAADLCDAHRKEMESWS